MFKKVILPFIAHLFLIASFISLIPIWVGDLFSHFRMSWTAFSVFLLIIYIILFNQQKVNSKIVMSVFFALFINFVSAYSFWTNSQTYEYLFFGSPAVVEYSEKVKLEIDSDKTIKKLLLMNVLSSNTNYEEVRRTIKNADADFVVIIELNKKWESELKELSENYPYKFTEVREDNFGMGIYSKISFTDSDIIINDKGTKELNGLKRDSEIDLNISKVNVVQAIEPSIFIKNEIGINIVVVHPIPPINIYAYRERNGYLNQKMEFVKQKNNRRFLLVGDLNCSPFSSHYEDFLKKSGLKDSQEKFGFQPTWNSSFPFLMQTQLDHVWHSGDIEILHRQTLPIEGSDHKAVLVVFR